MPDSPRRYLSIGPSISLILVVSIVSCRDRLEGGRLRHL